MNIARYVQSITRRKTTALVPARAAAPQPSPQETVEQSSKEQLFEQYAAATQNPPPGPGGVLGIGEPWDIPAPYETAREYRARRRSQPKKDIPGARESARQAAEAERRGDSSFAAIRKSDTRDKLQSRVDLGADRTWIILAGSCIAFLLITLWIILMPHGQDANQPTIWVY